MADDTEQVNEVTEQATPAVEPVVDQQAVEKRAEELYQARNFKMLREQAEQNARRAEAARERCEPVIRRLTGSRLPAHPPGP